MLHDLPGSRLEVLITLNCLTLWGTLGELFFQNLVSPPTGMAPFSREGEMATHIEPQEEETAPGRRRDRRLLTGV